MKKIVRIISFILLVAGPIVLWCMPSDFFDTGTSICPSKLIFDIECFGCGMTRAVMHLHHFEYVDAAYFNRASFIIYPAMIYYGIKYFIRLVKNDYDTLL